MSTYQAPLAEIRFVINELAGLDQVAALPGFEEATPDVTAAILEEAAKFATNVLSPLNAVGDREGAKRLDDGTVQTPPGFKEAYRQFCENGWNGLTKSTEFGGQGLPNLLGTAVEEMWHASNLAFNLCAMLTQGAIESIELAGSPALKEKFLPKMVAGTWSGTMNLTEPQAGSDLAAVRTKAIPQGDGTYKAYQRAVAFARERVQGKAVGMDKGATASPIIDHPDIRRMLMTMRASVEAMRAVAYVTGAAMDHATHDPDPAARKRHQAFVDFMIPIVKGHSTETAQQIASLGIQVHGGMGFIKETGAAQHYRDARIITIYEGTTGIQANDLVGRKTARDGGAQAKAIAAEIEKVANELSSHADANLQDIGARLNEAVKAARTAVDWVVATYGPNTRVAHAGAVPYLELG